MPLTAVDPNAALVVIDLQRGIIALPAAHAMDAVIERSARLAAAFRKHGQTVVIVNVDGVAPGRTDAPRPDVSTFPADWAEIVPELGVEPADLRVTKKRWGAFATTALDEELKQRGVTQIFLCGVATSAGVESTARFAVEYGYNVVFVFDAMTDRNGDAHDHCVERIFPRLGEVTTTQAVLEKIAGSA